MAATVLTEKHFSAGIFEQSMGARNRAGIGLSYRPARLHRLAESNPWNRFLGSLKVNNTGSVCIVLDYFSQKSTSYHVMSIREIEAAGFAIRVFFQQKYTIFLKKHVLSHTKMLSHLGFLKDLSSVKLHKLLFYR
jgi:hypothetical protein